LKRLSRYVKQFRAKVDDPARGSGRWIPSYAVDDGERLLLLIDPTHAADPDPRPRGQPRDGHRSDEPMARA
jgi:hypothetical protein